MIRTAIVLTAVLALGVAASASALDRKAAPDFGGDVSHGKMTPYHIHAYIGCDDGNPATAWFQDTDDRVGNLFDFGTGAILSQLQFAHYGFGFPGPYNYNLELWDPFSCTKISGKNGLVAADAADGIVVESLDLCGDGLNAAGIVGVMLDPNTCAAPNDCYPDLLYDDQINVFCPVIIQSASTSPNCFDVSSAAGPFLMRAQLSNCTTGTRVVTWGKLRNSYK